MPYVLAAILGVALLLFLQRRQRAHRQAALRVTWGQPLERDRDIAAIAAYFRALNPGGHRVLDDRGWSDLNCDDIFALLDRTSSAVGQQVLYARLRTLAHPDRNASFEALVTHFSHDHVTRERAQLALRRVSSPAGYDLWWLTRPEALETVWWHRVFPLVGISMLIAAVAAWFSPLAIVILIAGATGGLIARGAIAPQLRVVTGPFREVAPLLGVGEDLMKLELPANGITSTLHEDVKQLSQLRRIARWAGRDSSAALIGDLQATVIEYLNLVFWLDGNALFFGSRELRARGAEFLRVLAAVGEVDAAIAVASYRAGTPTWTRPVFREDLPALMTNVVHPLLVNAVPNSIVVGPPHGVIVTGSNMSGKSTFLRTVGVTVVLAQTINTCPAEHYEAPEFVVRTCIGRGDDLLEGKSYYLDEVESVLSLVHSADGSGERHLLLFDELFRGTNAVERIAAGEAVLRALLRPSQSGSAVRHIVLAATHDQELVDLLGPLYAACHFTDTIDANGLSFDYTLKPGAATTRNAIALLAQRGAPPDLVAHALARARTLDRTRLVASTGLGDEAPEGVGHEDQDSEAERSKVKGQRSSP